MLVELAILPKVEESMCAIVFALGRALIVAAPPSPVLTREVVAVLAAATAAATAAAVAEVAGEAMQVAETEVLVLGIEFLRTLPVAVEVAEPVLSLREPGPPLGRPTPEGPAMWSFCWWRRSRSRRAKHRLHSGHSNGFSLVWERSWRLRCSRRANDLWQVPQTWGRGFSVFVEPEGVAGAMG